jgi:hypothetical protein
MLAGFTGRLISEQFLEGQIQQVGDLEARAAALRRTLVEWRRGCRELGPASSVRALTERGAHPLARALGFACGGAADIANGASVICASADRDPVVIVVTTWGEALDPAWRVAMRAAARLGAEWCLLFNGVAIRLIETRRLYSRRHLEFNLDVALDDELTFRALAILLSARMFSRGHGSTSSPLHLLIAASEKHAAGACSALRRGVFDASTELLGAMLAGRPGHAVDAGFEQALTIVYRLLFLLFAEARQLVPLWHRVYKESYSVEALCETAARARTPRGLWDALRAISRLAHSGCRTMDLRVTPFNGRLFAPSRTPLADRRNLDEASARRALIALSTRRAGDDAGLEPIAYRDLGVEELGAVYESLLDYEPRVHRVRRSAAHPHGLRLSLEPGSIRRKTTGSFYTPQAIADYLVRRTLGPLVDKAPAERILALRVLDPSMGSGAFLVAACSYLASAYEAALIREGRLHPSDAAGDRSLFRRIVAERCLFGVDVNPMAVQLGRLSLWLATLAADKPLSFLDHHLATGDSLLGTWLSLIRQGPRVGGRSPKASTTLPLFEEAGLADTMRLTLPARFSLAEAPSDTVDAVRQKERTLAGLARADSALSRWKRVADVWCAGWFASGGEGRLAAAFPDLADCLLTGRGALPPSAAKQLLDVSAEIARTQKFFHWELEFPEIFFDHDGRRRPDGGFDAIIGNPPWDMVRGDAGTSEARSASRTTSTAVVRFTRDSRVYSAQSDGHANRYQLFVERAVALVKPGGRIGLVLPSGITGDHGSARLRRLLFSRCAVDELVGFENSRAIFPVHRSLKFVLLTATAGRSTHEIACRLGECDLSVLAHAIETMEPRQAFPIRVTLALLERLTGESLAIPELRTPTDLAIAERAAGLFAPLGDQRGWGATFGRELNATEDRDAFDANRGWPVIEGKTIDAFRVNPGAVRHRIHESRARTLLGDRCERARLAYRDVAGAGNRQTLIAAVIPGRTVSTHTVFCLRTPLPLRAQHFLCGLFNTFIVNYLVRLRVSTHVTTSIVERLPVPTAEDRPDAFAEIATLARLLARRPHPAATARLNALTAELYQLTPEELAHVLDTFPLVAPAERDRVMHAYLSAMKHAS